MTCDAIVIEDILGLSPVAPGWTEVGFKPRIPKSLTSLRFEFETIAGRISLRYDQQQLQVDVPDGVRLVIG